jgi:hypothetical protein
MSNKIYNKLSETEFNFDYEETWLDMIKKSKTNKSMSRELESIRQKNKNKQKRKKNFNYYPRKNYDIRNQEDRYKDINEIQKYDSTKKGEEFEYWDSNDQNEKKEERKNLQVFSKQNDKGHYYEDFLKSICRKYNIDSL